LGGGRHPSEWGGGWGPQLLRMKKRNCSDVFNIMIYRFETSEYAATTYTKDHVTTNDEQNTVTNISRAGKIYLPNCMHEMVKVL
jgi:hypothetical protein